MEKDIGSAATWLKAPWCLSVDIWCTAARVGLTFCCTCWTDIGSSSCSSGFIPGGAKERAIDTVTVIHLYVLSIIKRIRWKTDAETYHQCPVGYVCGCAFVCGCALVFVCAKSCGNAEGLWSVSASVQGNTSRKAGPVRWPGCPGGAASAR